MNKLCEAPFSKQIFKHGTYYYTAASRLYNSQEESLNLPICTLAAFAIECFLKALLVDDDEIIFEKFTDIFTKRPGVDIKEKYKKHLLDELFEMLPLSKKSYINHQYKNNEFKDDLVLISKYFVDTRYFFQEAVDTHALTATYKERIKIALPIQHFNIELVMDIADFLYSLILTEE